jgi:NADPH2:quinone reductase
MCGKIHARSRKVFKEGTNFPQIFRKLLNTGSRLLGCNVVAHSSSALAGMPTHDDPGSPSGNIVFRDILVNSTLQGATLKWFIVYDLDDAARDAGVADLNRMLADDRLTTTIAARFPLEEIAAAHDMVEAARHIGNVVVDIA